MSMRTLQRAMNREKIMKLHKQKKALQKAQIKQDWIKANELKAAKKAEKKAEKKAAKKAEKKAAKKAAKKAEKERADE